MATFDANIVRACAIELRERILELFTPVNALYQGSNTWQLNSIDSELPIPFNVKTLLDAYKRLTIERLKLEPWVSDIQKAKIGDVLSYQTPPIVGGLLVFDEISFETISF